MSGAEIPEREILFSERGYMSESSRRANPWLTHVRNFRDANPGVPHREALRMARATYTPSDTRRNVARRAARDTRVRPVIRRRETVTDTRVRPVIRRREGVTETRVRPVVRRREAVTDGRVRPVIRRREAVGDTRVRPVIRRRVTLPRRRPVIVRRPVPEPSLNQWVTHVQAYRDNHPGVTWRDALRQARATYQTSQTTRNVGRRIRYRARRRQLVGFVNRDTGVTEYVTQEVFADMLEVETSFFSANGFAREYTIDARGIVSETQFLEISRETVLGLLDSQGNIKFRIDLVCRLVKPDTGEIATFFFSSDTIIKTSNNDVSLLYTRAVEEIVARYGELLTRGSGWTRYEVLRMNIQMADYRPIGGSLYVPTPRWVALKKAVANMENDDNYCFMWAVTRCLTKGSRHPARVDSGLVARSKDFDWSMLEFPVVATSDEIDKFEEANEVCVNIYGLDNSKKEIAVIRLTNATHEKVASLLMITNLDNDYHGMTDDEITQAKLEHDRRFGKGVIVAHYCAITGINRLIGSQVRKTKSPKAALKETKVDEDGNVTVKSKPKGNKVWFCDRCMSTYPSEDKLNKHIGLKVCYGDGNGFKLIMPEDGTRDVPDQEPPKEGEKPKKVPKEFARFWDGRRKDKVRCMVCADFECFTKVVGEKAGSGTTTRTQVHVPCGFGFQIVSDRFDVPYVSHTIQDPDEDLAELFVKMLTERIQEIVKRYSERAPPVKLTDSECLDALEKGKVRGVKCVCCEKLIGSLLKEPHRSATTGLYTGNLIHVKCKRAMDKKELVCPKFVPVLFHNLGGYDSKLFIRALNSVPGKVTCLARNDQNMISFSKYIEYDDANNTKKVWDGESYIWRTFQNPKPKTVKFRKFDYIKGKSDVEIRFIDSYKFLLKGLSDMVETLGPDDFRFTKSKSTPGEFECFSKKGIYPYDYMNSFERMSETQLPPIREFHSKLYNKDAKQKDYDFAKKAWDISGCKTMRDYHDLYLKGDVLQLVDVMNRFRDVCIENFGLDPLHYYTIPGLAYDAMLLTCKREIPLIYDEEKLLFYESSIRGGMSCVMKRHEKANNKYMDDYDPSKPSKYILDLDENSMYATIMTYDLPLNSHNSDSDAHSDQWMTDEELTNWPDYPCFIEADWEYPKEIHDTHKDLTLAPFPSEGKLMATLGPRKNYVTHHVEAKCYLKYGMRVTKVHRGIKFDESPWMKPYIMKCIELRKASANEFEKAFFKLMCNSVYGKTVESIRNRVDFRLVGPEGLSELVNKPNYKGYSAISKDLLGVSMRVTQAKMNKPIYIGAAILGMSKALIFDFVYGFLKPTYGDKVTVLYTDTDSVIISVETEDYYEDMKPYLHSHFDTSNYPKDHVSGTPNTFNKGALGLMKDEMAGDIITEFVGLRPKVYSVKCQDPEKSTKRIKGVNKATRGEVTHEDFLHELKTGEGLYKYVTNIRGHGLNEIYTERSKKLTLSSGDTKRYILPNGVDTLPHGHYKIPEIERTRGDR